MMKFTQIRVLIVEDERAIRDMIRFAFPAREFILYEAGDTRQAMDILGEHIIDVILLDWMLPDRSGIEFMKFLRDKTQWQQIAIIMLTAKAEEENKIRGLDMGADDYVIKPFSPAELMARIRTVLRRGILVNPAGCVTCGDLMINVNTHEITVKGKCLSLTPIEYKLLHFFVTHQNKVYSREQLISQVWGTNVYIEERSVDVQMKRLRRQLKDAGFDCYLQTVRGVGYMFQYPPKEVNDFD
jgi:two-component system, OmpR family, phosphate regulon response regulator PhoB